MNGGYGLDYAMERLAEAGKISQFEIQETDFPDYENEETVTWLDNKPYDLENLTFNHLPLPPEMLARRKEEEQGNDEDEGFDNDDDDPDDTPPPNRPSGEVWEQEEDDVTSREPQYVVSASLKNKNGFEPMTTEQANRGTEQQRDITRDRVRVINIK